jgi:hypothetical protein
MYRPSAATPEESTNGYANRKDFEYLELMNISSSPLDLGGTSFTTGIAYTFPLGTVLPVGERVVIVKNLAGFNYRYAEKAPGPIAGVFTGSLANEGETLTLANAEGSILKSFSYAIESPWPTSAYHGGKSLVLVDPLANPDHGAPASWRSSVDVHGNPGERDGQLFVGDPLSGADIDMDGTPAWLEYVYGSSDTNPASFGQLEIGYQGLLAAQVRVQFQVNPGLSGVTLSLEESANLATWIPSTASYEGEVQHVGDRVWRRYTLPAAPAKYLRLRVVFSE